MWRVARPARGIRPYATSRTNPWANAYSSLPVMVCEDVRRISPRRRSSASDGPMSSPACIVASAPDQNGSPTTAASCRTERWADVSASSRAAIRPWIVSGRAIERDVGDRSLVREHPDELQRVQRVASGAGHERPLRLGREHGPHEQLGEQPLHVVLGERRQRHGRRVRLAGAPVAPDVEQLRPRRSHEQQRHVLEVLAQLIQEVQHGRVRPVEILDHEHGRRLRGLGGQERRPRGERLLAVGRRRAFGVDQAEQRREPGAQPVDVLRAERQASGDASRAWTAASSRSSERFTPVASRTTSSSGANVTDSP